MASCGKILPEHLPFQKTTSGGTGNVGAFRFEIAFRSHALSAPLLAFLIGRVQCIVTA
jgi:hypothetical protein